MLLFRLTLILTLLLPWSASARNVVLIIGDGMDDVQITIARNYLVGAEGRLLLDRMHLRSSVQVLSIDEQGRRNYVADSANTATAMATGIVTSRGRIATTAGTDLAVRTILEQASAAGLRTGLVTTSSVTDATPAAFVAHINLRTCEDPESILGVSRYGITLPACNKWLRVNGGKGSISEQIAAAEIDLVLGGGSRHFDSPAEGSSETVRQQAAANGFTVIDSAAEMASAIPGKLLGLFSPSTMPVRLRGENGRSAEAAEPSWLNRLHPYLGSVRLPAPMRCEPNPEHAGMPSLREMTAVALQRLHNERGFFLMVESASIDKQSHERKPCGSIGELQQLDEALAVVLDYAAKQPDTLVLVTADHGHAAQLIPETSLFSQYGAPIFSPGKIARIRTREGALLGVNYASNSFPYEEHTGTQVPLFANAAAAGRVPSMVTQPQIYEIMSDFLFGSSDSTGSHTMNDPGE